VPQYVAVLGRTSLYTRDDVTYASIWSNEISATTEAVRNNWVMVTAERTLDRLEALKIGLGAGLHAEALRAKLIGNGVSELLVDGIIHAAATYEASDVIADLIPVIASAIDAIVESRDFSPASEGPQNAGGVATEDTTNAEKEIFDEQRGEIAPSKELFVEKETLARNKECVLLALSELDAGSGLPYDRLIEILGAQDLAEDEVEEAVQGLMDEGKCYEPKLGILKLI
jgi:hypothetical protein